MGTDSPTHMKEQQAAAEKVYGANVSAHAQPTVQRQTRAESPIKGLTTLDDPQGDTEGAQVADVEVQAPYPLGDHRVGSIL